MMVIGHEKHESFPLTSNGLRDYTRPIRDIVVMDENGDVHGGVGLDTFSSVKEEWELEPDDLINKD